MGKVHKKLELIYNLFVHILDKYIWTIVVCSYFHHSYIEILSSVTMTNW